MKEYNSSQFYYRSEMERGFVDNDKVYDNESQDILILVNKKHPVNALFTPNFLVTPAIPYKKPIKLEKTKMVCQAAISLTAMIKESRLDGMSIIGISAYRSYETQRNIFLRSVMKKGLRHAEQYIALPGYSEHQTGLAIDVSSPDCSFELDEAFAGTKEYGWIKKHAHLYGYIIRYPKGKEEITGYAYEPWHIRYVGVEAATLIHDKGITLEEYLLETQHAK